jgi:FdhE protein
MTQIHSILPAEQIAAGRAGEIPFLRLPDVRSLFADRARRLRQLAGDYPLGDYLLFVARVADAQQALLGALPPIMLPNVADMARAHEHGMAPLAAISFRREPVWCDMLRRMLRRLADEVEGGLRDTLVKLEGMRNDYYEAQASKLLAGVTLGLDRAHAPLIGAALQVYWSHLVTVLGEDGFPPLDVPTLCPCCGSRPTASIARIGGESSGYRYLHCSLCSAEWHYVRIKCSNCESTKGIHYYGIEGGSDAVKAECCDECGTYRKILYQDKDPHVDPVADDLASLALDLLVAEQHGKRLAGVNFMLIHGEDEAGEDSAPPELIDSSPPPG